jgi:pyruvate formate lyase activating enzyme
VIFLEYAVDIAAQCRARGVRNVAVTAGYLSPAARPEFFGAMEAANIDLKGFTDRFYRKLTGAEIRPVLDSIVYAVHQSPCWVELTTLLIPGENDSAAEIRAMAGWVLAECGPDVPVHFTAFTPHFRMMDKPKTSFDSVLRAREIAKEVGLHHVYVGNVNHEAAQSSYCSGCGTRVIGRNWHELSHWGLDGQGHCLGCGTRMPGRFDGPPGTWGRKRRPVKLVERA